MQALRAALRQPPRTSFLIIRFWKPGARVWKGAVLDRSYRADPRSERMTNELARVVGGHAFAETQVGDAIRTAKRLVGTGPLVDRGEGLQVIALSRWLALAALLPLAFLLWRRNLV
jgi:hypothetical protein